MNRIPLAIPNIGEAEARNLQSCVDDNFVSSVGAFVNEFENRVAEVSGTTAGVATGAGTLALHLALHSLGVRHGDLVILPSFTFIASANAIAHTGAEPWLFDVDRESWTIDSFQVRAALERDAVRVDGNVIHRPTGKRVAAIMPVYTLGTPANMDELSTIADEWKLPVVADAAAAIGVEYKDQPIGSVADLTCYSFNGNKTITCGGGGMVVGNNDRQMQRIRHLSTTARVGANYDHDEVGFNYRMTNLQAAVGCAQLDRLDSFIEKKRSIRRVYNHAFKDVSEIMPFPEPDDRTSTCWFSGFQVTDTGAFPPDGILEHLRAEQIEARPFWKPIHLQEPYRGCPVEETPVSDDIWERIVTLPCSTMLTDEEQSKVINTVLGVFGS